MATPLDVSGSVTGVASLFLDAFPLLKKALEELVFSLPNATPNFLDSGRGLSSEYVTRPSLEDQMEKFCSKLTSKRRGAYTVVVGPKGAGKSFLIAHVFENEKGVVNILVSQVDTPTSCLRKLLASCGKRVEEGVPLGVEIFLPFLREAAQQRDGIPITIVLKVERGKSSQEVFVTIKGIAKQLALAANVIVILSEANAGLAFGDDKRQQFIWVDEMTNGEATEYARKFETNVSDTDLEILFENVGMLPLDIVRTLWMI